MFIMINARHMQMSVAVAFEFEMPRNWNWCNCLTVAKHSYYMFDLSFIDVSLLHHTMYSSALQSFVLLLIFALFFATVAVAAAR